MPNAFVPPWVHGPDPARDISSGAQAGGVTARNILSFLGEQNSKKEAAARQGLAERSEKASETEAGARLQQSKDSLAQEKELENKRLDYQRESTKASQALRKGQQDLLNEYRKNEIQNQRDRIKDAADKTQNAADALTRAHKETAAFVADAKDGGAMAAYLKHPDADKTVVDHMLKLETPTDVETTVEKSPGTEAVPGEDAYTPGFFGKMLGRNATPAIPGKPAVPPTTVTTRRTLSPSDVLRQSPPQAAATQSAVAPNAGPGGPPSPVAPKPQTATNPKTGQKLQLLNGQWQPIPPPQ